MTIERLDTILDRVVDHLHNLEEHRTKTAMTTHIVTRSAFFEGHPAPQGSKRHVGRGRMIESSKRVGPWRKAIAAAAAQQQPEMLPPAPVVANLQFVLPRPKQTPKRLPTPPAIKRNGDLDKLVRAVFDALTGVWIEDDCLIVELHTTKRIAEVGERPGVHVHLEIHQP